MDHDEQIKSCEQRLKISWARVARAGNLWDVHSALIERARFAVTTSRAHIARIDTFLQQLGIGPYTHRHNADGTVDSICHNCFMTIATVRRESDLEQFERKHVCKVDNVKPRADVEKRTSVDSSFPISSFNLKMERQKRA